MRANTAAILAGAAACIAAVVSLPEVGQGAASQPCDKRAIYVRGTTPSREWVDFPPPPTISARRVASRRVSIRWTMPSAPARCRPVHLLLSVVASGTTAAPTNLSLARAARRGKRMIAYPDFLAPPNTALASAYTADGRRSRTVRVAISP